MSEVRLVVRDAEREWSGTIHASCADRAVAALSADPVTLEELETAMGRFVKRGERFGPLGNMRIGRGDEPWDAGLVVIDLVARLVAVESSYSSPGPVGRVEYHNGECATGTWLNYHLADDWMFTSAGDHWRPLADGRRQERMADPPIDARPVFNGRPLMEFIARECFAAFARRDEIAAAARDRWIDQARRRIAKEEKNAIDEVDVSQLAEEDIVPKSWPGEEAYASPFYDAIKDIHAAWLLTPRDDLGGAFPREFALRRHDHLTWDLQDRCQQWSLLKQCPPGLDESSHAYRFGGFGTHELVKYYDLVRALLWSCWQRGGMIGQASEDSAVLSHGCDLGNGNGSRTILAITWPPATA